MATKATGEKSRIERLAEWLNAKRKETGWSFNQIAERSGGNLTHGTAYNISQSEYRSVQDKTVRGLAYAFNVPESELWDIVNGLVGIEAPSLETRPVTAPSIVWRWLAEDAERCGRSMDAHFETLLRAYYDGADVNLDYARLEEVRRGEGLITPHDEGRGGELPLIAGEDKRSQQRSAKHPRKIEKHK